MRFFLVMLSIEEVREISLSIAVRMMRFSFPRWTGVLEGRILRVFWLRRPASVRNRRTRLRSRDELRRRITAFFFPRDASLIREASESRTTDPSEPMTSVGCERSIRAKLAASDAFAPDGTPRRSVPFRSSESRLRALFISPLALLV